MKSLFFRPGLAVLFFSFAFVTLADTANGPGDRVSFNAGWRFARFDPIPDSSVLPKPVQPARAVTASSEETDKGNTAGMAIDGDSNTRWCAADESMNQWLAVDFGKITPLGSVEIEWEFELAYQYKVEVSDDGKAWKTVVDRTQNQDAARLNKAALGSTGRFVRVTVTSVPEEKWASICELRVLDPAGNRLQPAGGVPVTGDKRLQPVAPEDGAAVFPESTVEFNDSDWRKLNLPHDWGIEGPFKQEYPGETGKLPWWGTGWYRKHLEVPASDQGKKIYLDVDGAMSHGKVWLNGQLAGGWPYGYASWRVDLTPFVKFGGDNVIAVRLDNPRDSSRWYPGGGIYRNVWLTTTAPVHVSQWGTYITTPDVSRESATINLKVTRDGKTMVEAETAWVYCDATTGRPTEITAEVRDAFPVVTNEAEIKAVLNGIDRSTPAGRRDFVLLSLLFNTGARVSEVVVLKACDFRLTSPPHVVLRGKGRKERTCPIWAETARHGAAACQTSSSFETGPPLGYVPGQAWFGCCSHAFTNIGMSYSALPSATTLFTNRA